MSLRLTASTSPPPLLTLAGGASLSLDPSQTEIWF